MEVCRSIERRELGLSMMSLGIYLTDHELDALTRQFDGTFISLARPRNHTQETTFSMQTVPGMRFFVWDFAVDSAITCACPVLTWSWVSPDDGNGEFDLPEFHDMIVQIIQGGLDDFGKTKK